MEGSPDIIKSKIVHTEWDAFWTDTTLPENVAAPITLLVVSRPYNTGSAEELQLQKMMQACTLTNADYVIVPMPEGSTAAWHKLRDALLPKVVLMLGIMPQDLGISAMFHLFAPNKFNDCVWIAAPDLSAMEQQPEAKKQLWIQGLKPVFVDKTTSAI